MGKVANIHKVKNKKCRKRQLHAQGLNMELSVMMTPFVEGTILYLNGISDDRLGRERGRVRFHPRLQRALPLLPRRNSVQHQPTRD